VKRRITIPPLGKPATLRPRPRRTARCLVECAVMLLLGVVAVQSAIDLRRRGLGAGMSWLVELRAPAIATLTLSLVGAILLGKRIRRQMSFRFDRFGIHFRRRLGARVLPWRTVTRITPEPHWYGANIRVESPSDTVTVVGGYYRSAAGLLEFLESQLRYHARIEARVRRG